jgi:hypothetical protein
VSDGPGKSTPRPRRLVLLAFGTYAVVLFIGTHWPRLTLPGEGRPDLFIHVVAFGLWMLLAAPLGWFGRPLSGRNITLTMLVAAAWAGVDEATQAVPVLRRTAAWDDYGANVAGIAAAAAILGFIVWARRRGRAPQLSSGS